VADAHEQGFINEEEANKLLHYNARRYDSMLTDVFDLHLQEVLELKILIFRKQMQQVLILQFKVHLHIQPVLR
jgi:hypothetical protein